MEGVRGVRKKVEGHCSIDQSPQWTVVSVEEEEQQ